MVTRNRHIFTSVANSVTYLKIKSWIRDLAFRILEMNKACDLPTKKQNYFNMFSLQDDKEMPESLNLILILPEQDYTVTGYPV